MLQQIAERRIDRAVFADLRVRMRALEVIRVPVNRECCSDRAALTRSRIMPDDSAGLSERNSVREMP